MTGLVSAAAAGKEKITNPFRRSLAAEQPGDSREAAAKEAPAETSARKALASIFDTGDDDGLYRTLYLAGPFHTAGTSVALNFVGVKTPEFFDSQKASFQAMMELQNPDGSWAPYPTALPSKALTAYVALAMKMCRQNSNPHLEEDAAFRTAFDTSLDRAEAFHTSIVPCEEPMMIDYMHRLMHDVCLRNEAPLTPRFNPLTPKTADFLLHSRIGSKISMQLSMATTLLTPASAILGEHAARLGSVADIEKKLWVGLGLRKSLERTHARLVDTIEKSQDPTGGWAYITLGTAVNIMALHLSGRTIDDPTIARGLTFINSQKKSGTDGQFRHSFLNAELWDTAVAGEVMLFNGLPAAHPRMHTMLNRLLGEQGEAGLWPFAANSPNFPDQDSSASILQFLATAHDTATPDMQPRIQNAVRSACDELLRRQQKDGGFNAWFPTDLRFGRRTPGAMLSVAVDASAPDVTGRVLGGLVAARRSGLLTDEQAEKVDRANDSAASYLLSQQNRNGSWWSRWITGYLGSVPFIVGPLRLMGSDTQAPWMQKLRSFLETSQNEDGGWGEVVEADRHPSLAGCGPSTPAQTAFGLIASLGASRHDEINDHASMARAADWLQKVQQADGTWTNTQPLYTNIPGFDYYDAPFMTQSITTLALTFYQRALEVGVNRAGEEFYGGARR